MPSNFKTIQPGAQPLASDINQLVSGLSGTADVDLVKLANQTAAPLATTVVSGTVGVLNGAYKYQLVYVTGWVDSFYNTYVAGFVPGPEASITVANTTANVTIPAFTAPIVAVAIYRTAASGATGSEKYVGITTLSSGTTFVDNVADFSLGTNLPTAPTWLGTAIPVSVPTTNTTGTVLQLGSTLTTGYNSVNMSLLSPISNGVGIDSYGCVRPNNPNNITVGGAWGVYDKAGTLAFKVCVDGTQNLSAPGTFYLGSLSVTNSSTFTGGVSFNNNIAMTSTTPVLSLKTNASTTEGNEGRIEFHNYDSSQGVQLRYNSYDSTRAPFGLHLERTSSNTQTSLNPYLYVGGDITAGGILSVASSTAMLKITNTASADATLQFDRGSGANWQVRSSSGTVHFECDYNGAKTSYYDVFTLTHTTGIAWLKGNLNLGAGSSITIGSGDVQGGTMAQYKSYDYSSTNPRPQFIGNWKANGYWGIGYNGTDTTRNLRIGYLDASANFDNTDQVFNLYIGATGYIASGNGAIRLQYDSANYICQTATACNFYSGGTNTSSITGTLGRFGAMNIGNGNEVYTTNASSVYVNWRGGSGLIAGNGAQAYGPIYGSSKNAITPTEHYGELVTYADESPTHVFCDRGHAFLDATGICIVNFDPMFLETVNTNDKNYCVQLTGIKTANVYIDVLETEYFVVKGEPNKEFMWEAAVERQGYEHLRWNDADIQV